MPAPGRHSPTLGKLQAPIPVLEKQKEGDEGDGWSRSRRGRSVVEKYAAAARSRIRGIAGAHARD